MFEAVVGVLFLDADRNFDKVAQWLCDRFLRDAVEAYEEGEDYEPDDDDESTDDQSRAVCSLLMMFSYPLT